MKLAIISDTHFGDRNSQLAAMPQGSTIPAIGPKYEEFLAAVGGKDADLDYLVLAGDILDFSVASYTEAYNTAKVFFERARTDGVAKEIIYLAGNHDADIWHTVQQQRHIIKKLVDGKPPEDYRHSVAGFIDDRTGSKNPWLILDGVSSQSNETRPVYGGLFMDSLTDPPTRFSFAFPNLYILSDKESVLVTHGQYLEAYWAFLGEFVTRIAADDLKIGDMDIEEMVELNFPLVQLACSGVGQSGALTSNIVSPVQLDVKDKKMGRVKKYLKRFKDYVGELADDSCVKEWFYELLAGQAGDRLVELLESAQATRYSDSFISDHKVRERFRAYYKSSLLEIGAINDGGYNVPAPWRVVFGHTHQPLAWADPKAPKMDTVTSSAPRRLTLHNTGGWLNDGGKFVGAEVFLYDTAKGFSSVSIGNAGK